jgi:hypothetical protein
MVLFRAAVVSLLALTSLEVSAGPNPADHKQPLDVVKQAGEMIQVPAALPTSEGCADPSKLVGICNTVSGQSDPPPGSPYNYMYEQQIEEAACVRPGDSEEVVSAKVRRMWKQLEDPYLKCNVANFDVAFGNVLKYSFSGRNFDFLNTVVEVWKVDLNSVDPTDNRTLLDYVKKEIDLARNTRYEERLTYYYKFLRKNGAKHRSELDVSARPNPADHKQPLDVVK